MLSRHTLLIGRTSHRSAWIHSTPACWRKVVHKFKLADIGEGITECEVIKWNVSPTSPVQTFDPLCEVQSDKASVEITSPFEGVVKELLVAEGQVAKVGEGLCLIETEEEGHDDVAGAAAVGPGGGGGGGEGHSTMHPNVSTPAREVVEPPPPPVRRAHPLDPNFASSGQAKAPGHSDVDVFAAPSVRHFAKKNGVDISLLAPGSGKDGRVEKKDVEAYLARLTAKAHGGKEQGGGDVVVELGKTRYGMWKAMTKSLEIPTFGYTTSLDLTSLYHLLPTLNTSIPHHFLPHPSTTTTTTTTSLSIIPPKPPAVDPSAFYPPPSPPSILDSGKYAKLTYLPFLLKTLSKAALEWPLFRSSLTQPNDTSLQSEGGKPTLTIRPRVDIALALSTPTGLYTPTMHSVDECSIYTIASRVAHLAYLGRQVPCGLTTKEMPKKGGTITVSNIGAIGQGESAVPVLVPGGGVAIVALGRAKWVWDVDEEEVRHYYVRGGAGAAGKRGMGRERLKMSVSWSADHRVVEGAELAAFVESWRAWVEVPERLIGDGI